MTSAGRGQPSAHDTGGSDGQDRLAEMLSSFARTVHVQADLRETLAEIVRAAIELVPGCDEGSISVVRGRRVSSEAASGELPVLVDALQERFQEGPCLDATHQNTTVRAADLATETRWPQFASAAREHGAGGMLSLQLYVEGDDLGALNLLSRRGGAFDDESEHVGLMFAAHAAVAYAGARRSARMARGLATQQLIGQAQGILMERYKVVDDQAFAMLVRASQQTNVKLREIASQLVVSGELQGPEVPPPS